MTGFGRQWAGGLVFLAAILVPAARGQMLDGAEMEIALEHFGVGDTSRPGDWVALSVLLTDAGSAAREVVVTTSLVDADGDKPRPMRAVTSNPGVQNQRVWLYSRLPYWFGSESTLPVSVYEAARTDGGVGRTKVGLGQYETRFKAGDPWLATGHERTEIADGIEPSGLPDKWQGLIPLDALVWAEGDPWELTSERAQAVRDWVRAGGHLIVILPRVGSAWLTPLNNPLFELLPEVEVTRLEEVPLNDFRSLLSSGRALPPVETSVHVFEASEGAAPEAAMRILEDEKGRCVVARRLHGTGAVTLVGLDVTQSALAERGGIEPEAFWHRVLGRRGPLFTEREMATVLSGTQFNAGLRDPTVLDGSIPQTIAKTGRAAAGVLLGLVIFAIYWVVAGPGGFAVLKLRGLTRHAWLAFVLASAAFSVLAWSGARAIRPGRVETTHLRLLDHVYGQPVQRARLWGSVLIPWYGEAELSVVTREGELAAIAPWDPAVETPAPGIGFPDARAYAVPAWDLGAVEVPARATVKQVRVDWAGAPRWGMPLPLPAEGQTRGEIRLLPKASAGEREPGLRRPELAGVLTHDLPGPLTNVVLVVCRGLKDSEQLRLEGAGPGALLSDATAYSRPTAWPPGEGLDLGELTMVSKSRDVSAEAYLERLTPESRGMGASLARSPGQRVDDLTALAFFPLLEPPELRAVRANPPLARRVESHGWDVARWFTQPCVIIVGHMEATEEKAGPGAVAVDGRVAPARGRTVVRWVYPLEESPPRLVAPRLEDGDGGAGAGVDGEGGG